MQRQLYHKARQEPAFRTWRKCEPCHEYHRQAIYERSYARLDEGGLSTLHSLLSTCYSLLSTLYFLPAVLYSLLSALSPVHVWNKWFSKRSDITFFDATDITHNIQLQADDKKALNGRACCSWLPGNWLPKSESCATGGVFYQGALSSLPHYFFFILQTVLPCRFYHIRLIFIEAPVL